MGSPGGLTSSPPLLQQLPHWDSVGRESGEMLCMPSSRVAILGTGRVLFTATSFTEWRPGRCTGLSRMQSSGRCQIVITVRYNFLPPPLPLRQARGVHLFMETVRSWLSIFRQGLCWAEVTSHWNCHHSSFSSSSTCVKIFNNTENHRQGLKVP